MSVLLRPRKKLLLLSADHQMRDDLMALLTGMGFYVDYEDTLTKALDRFRNVRHSVVFIDERYTPSNSARLYQAFYRIQTNCIVVALVDYENRAHVFSHLADGAWDIMTLPLMHEEVVSKVQRLVKHHQLISSVNFLKHLVLFLLLLFPLLALTIWTLTK